MQRLRSRQGAAAQAPGHCCMQDTHPQGVHVSGIIHVCCDSEGLQGGKCGLWPPCYVAELRCPRELSSQFPGTKWNTEARLETCPEVALALRLTLRSSMSNVAPAASRPAAIMLTLSAGPGAGTRMT